MQRIKAGLGRTIATAAAAAAMLIVPGLDAQAPPASGAPTTFLESIDVNLVNVEVFVTDKQGNPLADLVAQDFQIFEDGKKMKITNFQQVGAPARASAEGTAPGTEDRAPEAGGRIVLLVDNLTINPQNRRLILREVRKFVEDQLRGGSEVMIASYEGHLRIRQGFTRDRGRLLWHIDVLEQLGPLGVLRETERRSVLRDGLRTLQEIQRTIGSDTRGSESAHYLSNYAREIDIHAERIRGEVRGLLFALSHLVNALAVFPGRKALVYVSDGIPMRPGDELYYAIQESSSRMQPRLLETGSTDARHADINNRSAALGAISAGVEGSQRSARRGGTPAQGITDLSALANAGGVSFYPIKVLGNLGGVPADLEGEAAALYTPQLMSVRETNLSDTLRVMADSTGGATAIGADIGALLRRAEADLSRYYSLAYTPAHSGDGKYHEIKLKIRRKGARVRYRTGYVDKPLAAKLADRTSAALLLGLDHNPLGVSFEAGNARPGAEAGQWLVTLTVRIPLDRVTLAPSANLHVCELQLFIGAEDVEGRTAPIQGGALRIEVPQSEMEGVAAGRPYATQLQLLMHEGPQRLALGIVDPVTGSASFVSRDLVIGTGDAGESD